MPKIHTPEQQRAIALSIEDPGAYCDEVTSDALAFLERNHPTSPGQATIMMIGAYDLCALGDEHHDQVLMAGLGLAVDRWLERESLMRKALAGTPKIKA